MVRDVEPAYGLITPYPSFIIEVQAVLAAGANVLFVYQGEVISVREAGELAGGAEVAEETSSSVLGAMVELVVSLVRRIVVHLIRAF
jgi:hypothetical protein